MVASSSADCITISAASFTSKMPRSGPPVTFIRTPFAPSMVASKRGLAMACMAASFALFSPWAIPIPISAEPVSIMTVLTSAKSRFIRPGTHTRSEIPCTPWRRTSSATLNASRIDAVWSTTCNSLSLGMTIRVSTDSCNLSMPSRATAIRRRPSKENGFVTTPTVNAPTSLAAWATIGAPPVPVPPPMPAVTNTMSAPLRCSKMSSLDSSAAFCPTSGLAPAPSPLVRVWPIWILVGAFDRLSD